MFTKLPLKAAKYSINKAKSILQPILLSYPKRIECNICGWEGRHFSSDSWHKQINCPKCRSGIRQRLFVAALQNIEELSYDRIISNKTILHFAPERIVSLNIRNKAARYTTADFSRQDCDVNIDMSHMPEIESESFCIVIAFDVLEHVPDFRKALEELHRILSPGGYAILSVPQKDNLDVTYEDPTIVSPGDRKKHFGQWDHLRIFGDDFSTTVSRKGFRVITVDESMFSKDTRERHILSPPRLSNHSLATNFRKIFFCQKTT